MPATRHSLPHPRGRGLTSNVLLRASGLLMALRQMSATSAQEMPCVMRLPCRQTGGQTPRE